MSRCDLHVLAAAALCLSAVDANALVAQAAARTSPAITAADLRSRLFRIADDSMLGRETGSKGAFQTADYVAAEFKRLGLTPMGEQGTWFQAVPFWVFSGGLKTIDGGIVGRTTDGSPLGRLVAGTDFVVIPRAVHTTLDGPIPTILGGVLDDPTPVSYTHLTLPTILRV